MPVTNVPPLLALNALLITYAYCDDSNKVCFDELGCIPFHDCSERTVQPPPYTREVIHTTFTFYTREAERDSSPVPAVGLTSDILQHVPFKAGIRTVMIVHGWLDSSAIGEWMEQMKDAILSHSDYNVVLVEWIGGNGPPYSQASVNTRVVGAEIGLLISKLSHVFGIAPASVHLFGHSLGGHAIGFAGKWLKGSLGRITAMDPAKPLFQRCQPEGRLSNTDAQFVEVIHTDSAPYSATQGLGLAIKVGDVDYYPNGGIRMPGCDAESRWQQSIGKKLFDIARTVAMCNHQRAVDYSLDFIENSARESTCLPIAFPCADFKLFERGQCTDCGPDGDGCAIVSLIGDEFVFPLHKTKESQALYLITNSHAPFCMYHYSIEIGTKSDVISARLLQMLASSLRAEDRRRSMKLFINLRVGGYYSFDLRHDSREGLRAGATYRYLIVSEEPLEDVESIKYLYQDTSVGRVSDIPLQYLKFTPLSALDAPNFDALSRIFCPPSPGVHGRVGVVLREELC